MERSVMERVLELEIWSYPEQYLPESYGRVLGDQFIADTNLDDDVFIAINLIHDSTDVENLAIAIDNQELEISDFLIFCQNHHLAEDLQDCTSAFRFLEYSYGRLIAWLHIKENTEMQVIIRQIAYWTQKKGYALIDPDTISCLIYTWDQSNECSSSTRSTQMDQIVIQK